MSFWYTSYTSVIYSFNCVFSVCLVKALFDYEAVGDDEVSFNEGDIIQVTKKDDNGVDDGFWEGNVNGQFGVFPSLVVEEIEGSEPQVSTTSTTVENEESTYSVPLSTTVTSVNQAKDDYIELPKDYVPGASNTAAINSSPSNSSQIQPKRKAPQLPSFAMERRRVQTENLTTMKKPDNYQRAVSQEYPPASWNSNINRSLSSNAATSDYVNVKDLPEGGSNNSGKPPKPPPPTANSRRSYSKSAV